MKGLFMRTTSKIRKALLGAASATVLTAGALAATTASASAATTPGGPWHGCYGYGCIGKSAQATGCDSDAVTVYAISAYDGLNRTRVTLRLRYSEACQSAWATVTDIGRPDRALFWVYDRGTHAIESAATERAWFTAQWQTTTMVGVAQTKAQACIEVRTQRGLSAPVCTPFFGH
jgi:hypothetical protein